MATHAKTRTIRSPLDIPLPSPILPEYKTEGVFLYLTLDQVEPGDYILNRVRRTGLKAADIEYQAQASATIQLDDQKRPWSGTLRVMYLDGSAQWRHWQFGLGTRTPKPPILAVFRVLPGEIVKKKKQKPRKS
jgi:hypothetical protein